MDALDRERPACMIATVGLHDLQHTTLYIAAAGQQQH
eukprot:COSAG06_NODE_1374_length_9637_cov_3.311186_3_plen_37_part_00